jgi:hypothetical protein
MSIIELQFSKAAFLAAQRAALLRQRICRSPITVEGTQILIDRIEFGDSDLRHDVPTQFPVFFASETSTAPGISVDGFQTQLAQDVTVFITTVDDVLAHPNQAPGILFPVSGTLVFNLDFFALDTECFFRTELSSVEPAALTLLPPGLPLDPTLFLNQITSTLQGLIPGSTAAAGLAPLASLWAKFVNAGVSVDPALERITFRAQIGGDNESAITPWKAFFNGSFADRIGTAGWSTYIDAGLLTEWFKAQINAQIGTLDVDHLQLFVGCNYSNASAKATFTLDVQAVYELPAFLGDVSRDPYITMVLSVDGLNTLKLLVDYSNVIEVIHSFAIVEFALPTLSEMIEGLLQGAVDVELADVNSGNDPPYCQKIDTALIQCRKWVRLPQVLPGTLASVVELRALEDGIAFAGPLSSAVLSPPALSIDAGPFVWAPPHISCGQSSRATVANFRANAASESTLRAQIHLNDLGTTPIYLCGAPAVINDPSGLYAAATISVDQPQLPSTITVTVKPPGPTYPLDMVVTTTAGTRLIRVPAPPAITSAIVYFLVGAVEVQLKTCDLILNPWFLGSRIFDVGWIIDPLVDPDPEFTEHLWNVEITGLETNDRVDALDASGQRLASSAAQAASVLRLSFSAPPGQSKDFSLSLNKGRALGAETMDRRESRTLDASRGAGIDIRQQPLVRVRSIALGQRAQSLLPLPWLGSAGVAVVMEDTILGFDLSNPGLPTPVGQWMVEGLRGALVWRNQLLAFGVEGFANLQRGGVQAHTGRCERLEIRDVAVGREMIHVLTEESLEVRSSQLCTVHSIPVPGGRTLLPIGRWLYVGGANGLSVYDTHQERTPRLIASTEPRRIVRLARFLDSRSDRILAILSDGSAQEYVFANDALHRAAHYGRTPWFARSLRCGRSMVTLDGDGRSLHIGNLGVSRWVVPIAGSSVA